MIGAEVDMPLPKTRDGQKLSLTLPTDVVRRVKLEAIDHHTTPAMIVLEALAEYWGGENEASYPATITRDPRKRELLKRQMDHLGDLVALGKLTVGEIASAVGEDETDLLEDWHAYGYVPEKYTGRVARLLALKNLPLKKEKDAQDPDQDL
jgi:hypothetical protein